jgi:hypothetical protein
MVHEFASSLKKYLYLGLLLIQGGPTLTQRIDFENIFEYTYLHFFICHTVFPSQNTDKMTVNYECVFFLRMNEILFPFLRNRISPG